MMSIINYFKESTVVNLEFNSKYSNLLFSNDGNSLFKNSAKDFKNVCCICLF